VQSVWLCEGRKDKGKETIMRKILFVLVGLFVLAAPAIARQDVSCEADLTTVTVSYEVVGGGSLIRAFGLDISVDNGATIESVGSFDPNYYVAPGTYTYNAQTGDVDWGNPIADGGAGSSYMIIEMGLLYADNDPCGHTTPPGTSGILLVFDVNLHDANECNVTIEENAARGGVVLEDGQETPDVNLPCTCKVVGGWPYPDCWDGLAFCYGDGDGDLYVGTSDWPSLRDAFFKNYWDNYPADPCNPQVGEYDPCGDFTRNGVVDTEDWPPLRDNFFTSPLDSLPACTPGDPCEVYKPGSVKP
jgi:hypothetical protein